MKNRHYIFLTLYTILAVTAHIWFPKIKYAVAATTTTYGYKVPEAGDLAQSWMQNLADNWSRLDQHVHDGTRSATLSNSAIASGASIARSKLGTGTANEVVINDTDGTFTSEAQLAISRGGTNASSASSAFDNLTPLTTKGDLIGFDGSNSSRVPVSGTNGFVLTEDSAQTSGFSFQAAPSAPTWPYEMSNISLTAVVSGNSLGVRLKTQDGGDPSSGDPVKIAMRDSDVTNGGYNQRQVTGPLYLNVSSGSTLGHESGVDERAYVYAIDNSGTIELAIAGSRLYSGQSVVSTTAEGGAGGADSKYTLYSETARTQVPARLIGEVWLNEATAGTYATSPTLVAVQHAPITGNGEVQTEEPEGVKIVSAHITNSGTPTLTSQTGNWISSIDDDGVGKSGINVISGVFSSVPRCVCTVLNASSETPPQPRVCQIGAATTTTKVDVFTLSGAAITGSVDPAFVDNPYYLRCEADK